MLFWAYLIIQVEKQQHFLQLWQQLSFHFNHTDPFTKFITKTLIDFAVHTFCLTFNFIQINHFRRQHSKNFVSSYYIWTFKSDIKQLVLPNRHMVTNYNSHVSVQLPTAWAIAKLRLNTMDEISLKWSRFYLNELYLCSYFSDAGIN